MLAWISKSLFLDVVVWQSSVAPANKCIKQLKHLLIRLETFEQGKHGDFCVDIILFGSTDTPVLN